MSYHRLEHSDQSRVSPEYGNKSLSKHSGDGRNRDSIEEGNSKDFELRDLSDNLKTTEFDVWGSDDGKDTETLGNRRASVSTVQSFMLYTPDEEKTVIRKFDKRLVLFVAFLYMLSFLDRSSIFSQCFGQLDILT